MVPTGGKPTVRSRRVGAELRRLRENAGMTTAQAADVLACSAAKISRIENGIVTVRVVDLRLLLGHYGVADPDHSQYLERLARESNKQGWWQSYSDNIPPYYADFLGLEADATYIKTWEPTSIPGLLQTTDYARAVMLANPALISPNHLDKFLTIRRERQARLTGDTSVRLDAVIWEPALLTTMGDEEVHQGQLRWLLELAERPNISLQVLPVDAGDHASMSCSFVLFSFRFEMTVNTVFLENLTSCQYLEKEDDLRGYTLVFDALRSAALSPAASGARIRCHLRDRRGDDHAQ
jgi:transcriptional regulator with XRE-family HTH domain